MTKKSFGVTDNIILPFNSIFGLLIVLMLIVYMHYLVAIAVLLALFVVSYIIIFGHRNAKKDSVLEHSLKILSMLVGIVASIVGIGIMIFLFLWALGFLSGFGPSS